MMCFYSSSHGGLPAQMVWDISYAKCFVSEICVFVFENDSEVLRAVLQLNESMWP